MKLSRRTARFLSLAVILTVCCLASPPVLYAQKAEALGKSHAPPLIQQMAGTWKVQQRMWPGHGGEAIRLPPAVAHRRIMTGDFLQEIMEPAQKSKEPFIRTAYFNYNAVSQQYEYFSLDSRAPQMMIERSDKVAEQSRAAGAAIKLNGGQFVAPQWGKAKNVAFAYRLTVGPIEKDRQVVQLYLTPQAEESPKEFLAFEYVYTRQH